MLVITLDRNTKVSAGCELDWCMDWMVCVRCEPEVCWRGEEELVVKYGRYDMQQETNSVI